MARRVRPADLCDPKTVSPYTGRMKGISYPASRANANVVGVPGGFPRRGNGSGLGLGWAEFWMMFKLWERGELRRLRRGAAKSSLALSKRGKFFVRYRP